MHLYPRKIIEYLGRNKFEPQLNLFITHHFLPTYYNLELHNN